MSLVSALRAVLLQANYMKGQAAVNTTRDYIRAAVFFANSAILLTTFAVGYAGEFPPRTPDDSARPTDIWGSVSRHESNPFTKHC